MAWFWAVILHDELEETVEAYVTLCYCEWLQTLKITADSVLLLHWEPSMYKMFKQRNQINRRHIVLVSLLPVDATHHWHTGYVIFLC